MRTRLIRLVLLGLLASLLACGLLFVFIAPEPSVGRLEFKKFVGGGERAAFLYHPPRNLKGSYLLLCTYEDEAGSELTHDDDYESPREKVPFAVVSPTNAVWRLKAAVFIDSTGQDVLYRIGSVLRNGRLNAWNSHPSYYVGSLVSGLITNPLPHTLPGGTPPRAQ